MNLGNKLAIGEVVDHGADHDPADHATAGHAARVAPAEVVTPTGRVEAPPEPVSLPVPAHAD